MVEVHFTFKDKNGGSFVFFCQQSSGLRRTHLWWIPSKFSCQVTILWHRGHAIVISSGLVIPWSLSAFYFYFFSVCVATSGVTYYLLKKGLSAWWITPALLTLRQGNRQIAAPEASLAPLSHLILTVVSPPREPGPRNIPSTPFFVKDSFSLSHLFGSAAGDTELEFPQ